MPNRTVMWICAVAFLLATVLNLRDLLDVANPPWKAILAPVSSGALTLFAVIEAVRKPDDVMLKTVSLALVAVGALVSVGRWFL